MVALVLGGVQFYIEAHVGIDLTTPAYRPPLEEGNCTPIGGEALHIATNLQPDFVSFPS